MQKYKYIFQIKYKEAILSNSIWNCYGFNYQNADCSFKKLIYCVSYYNFWHTFVPNGKVLWANSGQGKGALHPGQ